MAEFAGNGTQELDEDELMAELEGMMAEDAEPPPPVDAEAAEAARLAEIAELEAKLAARKMQKEWRPCPPRPRPTASELPRSEEKAGLLQRVVLSS